MILQGLAVAQTPSLLYSFDPHNMGIFEPFPPSVMAQGPDGNLYGTTSSGGTGPEGGVFMLTPGGIESVLYNFAPADGQHCNVGLTLGNDGNFYGACLDGGPNHEGKLYRITTGGTFTTLYSFTGMNGDGALPNGPPIQASDGNFYGTTEEGGAENDGAIYKMTPAGKVTIIHSFVAPAEGGNPGGALVQGSDGNFYGTTQEGGGIFQVTPTGKLKVIHALATMDGQVPLGALIQGSDGDYYGTATLGGIPGQGTVYKVSSTGQFMVLHDFDSTVDGQGDPWVGLVQASDGNYYGVSFRSGLSGESQFGGIFELSSQDVYSSLYLFDGTVGANPASALIQHTNGLLYGNTQNDGALNVGTIYSMNIGAAPFCLPNLQSGKIGNVVGILGQNFDPSSVVRFGGVAATGVKVIGPDFLTAAIPSGALSGAVTVNTGTSKLTSRQTFKVLPTIKSFSPTSGPVGTPVIITGSGFTQTIGVGFGAYVPSKFTVNSDTQVTATVSSGSKTGPVGIETKGGIAISPEIFTVTP
jgi:uncharacterized repeat protein (TIGR03803 family)